MKEWINDAIFYEIYPTSFKDSNGDGIGDLKGITSKLDYVKSMGFNAIWLNPFYKSPFKDGGYDVSDFFDVDPRFGTMADFDELLAKAKKLGIRIIVDLVAGHSSEENREFLESAKAERNEYSDLFIWNASPWDLEQPYRLIAGRHDRFGCYMVNFFSVQPAFNYGFNVITHPNWQMSYKDPRTFKAREYLKSIIRFWLKKGVDGFRVDMADSLVKNDDNKVATMEIWKEIHEEVFDKEFPDAMLVSEWSDPSRALACGFDVDFVLDHWDNFSHRLGRSHEGTRGPNFFHGGDQKAKIEEDLLWRISEAKKNHGKLGLISGNHDTPRIATGLTEEELRSYYLVNFTLPGVPFVYYGDEIEMKHVDMASKDGGFQRTGDRLPMKWNNEVNKGFSTSSQGLYLPLDNEDKTVESEENNPSSFLNYLKDLIKMRNNNKVLVSDDFKLNHREDNVLSYERGDLKILVNASGKEIDIPGNEIIFATTENAVKDNKLQDKCAVIYR
jgi:maltose alpha-D-glucosyltransferase/alpha-amylase